MNKPFKQGQYLSSSSIDELSGWLEKYVIDRSVKIAEDYTIGDLINDLDCIADGVWSDGIDAMGEDA